MLSRSAAGVGIALTGSLDHLFGASPAAALGRPARVGYGPLVDDPAGLLSLPKGFSYSIVAQSGVTKLESGEPTPSDPDGTASFVRRGGKGSVLINNHEISGTEPHPVPHVAGYVYDPDAGGGTTTIVVDQRGRRVREYVSLAGTHTNCAGGRTPWNTWLTCEETEAILSKRHGYVFEVDPYSQRANRNPKPIKALGRYAHESLAVDPREGRIYLTEDASSPERAAVPLHPAAKGAAPAPRLAEEAGRRRRQARRDAGVHAPRHLRARPVRRDQARDDVPRQVAHGARPRRRDASTRTQFTHDQITRSRKLEGMWWGDGGAYFVASFARTSDGSAAQHDGQVWFLDPRDDTIELKLHFAYTPADQDSNPDGPDNITVSAYGGLIIAEDGEGKQHLVGSTERGKTFFFARNDHPDDSEFAGPNFSHDRSILFANVQSPGYVFAIRGPFKKQR